MKGALKEITTALALVGTFFHYRYTPKAFLSFGNSTCRLLFLFLAKKCRPKQKLKGAIVQRAIVLCFLQQDEQSGRAVPQQTFVMMEKEGNYDKVVRAARCLG
jgi:hypothetical protein